MVRSMTGFGTGQSRAGQAQIVAEARSVNSKSCDIKTRLPRELGHLEPRVQNAARSRISRGRVDITVELTDAPDAVRRPRLNLPLARGYAAALDELAAALGVGGAASRLDLVWTAPGVLEHPPRDTGGDLDAAVESAVGVALSGLESMRTIEGAQLSTELFRLHRGLREILVEVAAEIPRANTQRKARFSARLAELSGEIAADPLRVAQEIAILLERGDVTEELARLDSHLAQFEALLSTAEPIGRRLEFLLQEMQRETNTLGSKSSIAALSHRVVDAKSVLDRLREQALNVE